MFKFWQKDEEKQPLTPEGVAKNIEKARKLRNASHAITGFGALLAVSSFAAMFISFHKDTGSSLITAPFLCLCACGVGMTIVVTGCALTAIEIEKVARNPKHLQSTKEKQKTTQQTLEKDQHQLNYQQEAPVEQTQTSNLYPTIV